METRKLQFIVILAVITCGFSVVLYKTFSYYNRYLHKYDVAVICSVNSNKEIGQQSLKLMEVLSKEKSITFFSGSKFNKNRIPERIKKIVRKKRRKKASVVFYEMIPRENYETFKLAIVSGTDLRIIYSNIDLSSVLDNFSWAINDNFDAVIISNPSLLPLYRSYGIHIPIFEVPSLDCEEKSLKSAYQTLILPDQVVHSDGNKIRDGIIYTNSDKLFDRYSAIIKNKTLFRAIMNSLIVHRYQ